MTQLRPRLVYDGQCGFCRYTVDYARALTGDSVEYRAYQDVADEHAGVGISEFAASIQLFNGAARYQGAAAAFETLALGGRGTWIALYRRLPGFAALSEWLYQLTARHRELCYTIGRALFGPRLGPRTHVRIGDLLFRGIALCGLIAFLSFWWQAMALIGSHGILPVAPFLDAVAAGYGSERFWLLPTLFWLNDSDPAIHAVCGVGVLAAAVALTGRLRVSAAVTAYVCYLSLVHAGQVFMAYQWDILLAECLVLAAVIARAPTLGVWVARLLLFRFMLLSGAVKLLSGDSTWADATALQYHFETQPLPSVLAWYAQQLPPTVLRWGVYATFVIELVLPFLIFLPRNPRLLALGGFVLLEVLIALTGSYGFFNLLTMVLCIALLDDPIEPPARAARGHPRRRWFTRALALLVMVQGLTIVAATLMRQSSPNWTRLTAPLFLANGYGLFAVMTTQRDELVIEGSMDGERWLAYRFPFKPGQPTRAPVWAAPHQPRVDWQMWFAALGPPAQSPWIYDFASRLLEAEPVVLGLIEDPFQGQAPALLRIQRLRYRFSTPEARARSGAWWQRGPAETWLGPLRLRRPIVSHGPLTIEP
jgi:predicted DCC family thiol-disulfide oxidoreductase YuxK